MTDAELASHTFSQPIASLPSLIEFAAEARRGIPTGISRLAFRGQPKAYGTLQPSIAREITNQTQTILAMVESSLIKELNAFLISKSAQSPAAGTPNKLFSPGLDLLSELQHSEVPTRFLDWTEDFWVAVYFASSSQPDETAELWIYDRRIFQEQVTEENYQNTLAAFQLPLNIDLIEDSVKTYSELYEYTPARSPRIQAQRGHHTFSSSGYRDHLPGLLSRTERFNSIIANQNQNAFFRRMLIAPQMKPKLLSYLADHRGISPATIFPDIAGLGRYLRWQLSSIQNMLA